MRRIICIALCALSVFALAVPAFALSSSGTTDAVYYPVLTFDIMKVVGTTSQEGTSTYPFVYNSAAVGSTVPFSYGSTNLNTFTGSQATIDASPFPVISGFLKNLNLQNCPLELLSGAQIIDIDSLSDGKYVISTEPSELLMESVRFSCSVWSLEPDPLNPNKYKAVSRNFTYNIINEGTFSTLDVGNLFSRMRSFANSEGLLFCRNIALSIKFCPVSAATPSVFFRIATNGSTTPRNAADFANWVYFEDVDREVTITNPNVLSWLTESVQSFLKTEFFPGFSIDKLFVIVLTVGVLLWFITLLI